MNASVFSPTGGTDFSALKLISMNLLGTLVWVVRVQIVLSQEGRGTCTDVCIHTGVCTASRCNVL